MNMIISDTILTKIKYYAKTTPNKICIVQAATDNKITYSDFWNGIKNYASDIDADKRYILQTMQSIEHLVAFYGVQLAGSIAIPVEANATDERLNALSKQFDAEIISKEYKINYSDTDDSDITLPDSEQIACIICTTGTTGQSKGVMSSFRCRFCGADNVRYSYDITPDDVALVPQVLSHSGGLRRVEAMLVSGATVVIMNSAMLFGNVFGAIRKYQCNILQFVPAQVAQILNRAENMLIDVAGQLRIVSVGSAVIPEHDKERLRTILPEVRLFNDFGSTEAVGSVYFEWSAFEAKPGCVGSESLHSRIVFIDDNGSVMGKTDKNYPGIIATEGGTLMSGYYNAPDITSQMMKDGRVLSADLGYRGEDGMIYILGRKDDVIVSGANKISPSEIEDIVLDVSGIRECACVPKPDAVMGQMPALFVVLNDNNISKQDIVNILEEKTDHFKVPRAENIYFVNKLPKTEGTGKVIKRELVKQLSHY